MACYRSLSRRRVLVGSRPASASRIDAETIRNEDVITRAPITVLGQASVISGHSLVVQVCAILMRRSPS